MRIAILLAVGLLFGVAPNRVGHGEAGGDTPKAAHEECQKLQAALEEADADIKRLEHQIERQRKAIENYQYVREQNGMTIERLEQWVESK